MGSGATKTLTTSPDERGMVHRVIIEDNVVSRGKRKFTCPGRLVGSWRAGDEVVVKVLEKSVPDEHFWDEEIEKCRRLREHIISFGKTVNLQIKIHVEYPMTAYVDKVSKWMKEKMKLKEGEFVLVEEPLGKDYAEMLNSCGKVEPKLPQAVADLLGELMHFTYHESCRKEIFCGFQGTVSGNVVSLSEPTVHSVDTKYREADMGLEGIITAFESHRCTARCHGWLKPGGVNHTKFESICTTV